MSEHLLQNYRARGINVILNQDTVEIRQEDGLKVVVTKDRSTGEVTETKVERNPRSSWHSSCCRRAPPRKYRY